MILPVYVLCRKISPLGTSRRDLYKWIEFAVTVPVPHKIAEHNIVACSDRSAFDIKAL